MLVSCRDTYCWDRVIRYRSILSGNGDDIFPRPTTYIFVNLCCPQQRSSAHPILDIDRAISEKRTRRSARRGYNLVFIRWELPLCIAYLR